MPIPFHCTSEFLVLPVRWRLQFLELNLEFRALVESIWAAQEAAEKVFRQFGDSSKSEEAESEWEELWNPFDAPCRVAWSAASRLAERFLVTTGPSLFDPVLGPPAELALLPGPVEALELSDPWDALVKFGFPDVPVSQLALEANKERPAPGDMRAWTERLKAEAAGRLSEWVARVRPEGCQGRAWKDISVRQQRQVRSALRSLLQELGLPHRRTEADSYYRAVHRIWCLREGWTGTRYDPRQAIPLRQALLRAGTGGGAQLSGRPSSRPKYELYWRAFRLITGQRYSSLAWEVMFGRVWLEALGPEEYRRIRARRDVGRRRGQKTSSRVKVSVHKDLASNAAPDPQAEACIEEFRRLVHTGKNIEIAAAESEIPDWVARMLLDPANRNNVNEWADRERAG